MGNWHHDQVVCNKPRLPCPAVPYSFGLCAVVRRNVQRDAMLTRWFAQVVRLDAQSRVIYWHNKCVCVGGCGLDGQCTLTLSQYRSCCH